VEIVGFYKYFRIGFLDESLMSSKMTVKIVKLTVKEIKKIFNFYSIDASNISLLLFGHLLLIFLL